MESISSEENGIEEGRKELDREPLLERTPLLTAAITSESHLTRARRLLYTSHFFAQFSEGAWQFALILFLAAFSNYQSLLLVSTYGLANGLAVCVGGARVGRFVDGTPRLVAAQWFIWLENLCVVAATGLCYLLFALLQVDRKDNQSTNPLTFVGGLMTKSKWLRHELTGIPTDATSIMLLVGIHILGPLASILDTGFRVAIERDWIVVMSEQAHFDGTPNPQKTWLSQTNVNLKQIDLACRIAAPAVSGLVIGAWERQGTAHGKNLTGAAILVGVVNVVALAVEYICTDQIYRLIPSLSIKNFVVPKSAGVNLADIPDSQVPNPRCRLIQLPLGLRVYLEQPISIAGIGLSLLYVNTLTFGAIMTAYLVWRGMRLETVGIWRGVSASVGLAGTFVYHFSVSRTTVANTGMWSVLYQFVCLSLSFASFFVHDYNVAMMMLITGVCASRIGLWVFDIAVTQLQQEFVPDGIRGIFGGTQSALNAFSSLIAFGLALVLPDPRQFHIYAAIGYSSVGLAALCYMLGVFVQRNRFVPVSEGSVSI